MQQAQVELWVMEAQAGSKKAFSALCQHFYPRAIGFAIKIAGDMNLAQDAVQDALLKLSKTIYKLEDPATINAWVFKLVRWQVLDHLKTQNRYQSLDDLKANECEIVEAEHGDETKDLQQVLIMLPPIEGQVLYLFYLEQFSIAKISKILEIPEGTVKSRLFRARKLFKQYLEQEK
ncbi:RNA polymerase sigma factor [Shewanella abyssi]|uniref:RNA polymerase sigma factor n=1 Tax=Shewanella abyssi TaxID=311789 RepID=UPI00200DF92B|nr:RNA polymerase sigma factor [Shewanella abyssi]MCL1048564.1 RNA polymerase sigma factor [Shewanella abyssi]